MDRSYFEVAKLKALREFGAAIDKPYEEWTEDERMACAMLDSLWRQEHNLREIPNVDDAEHRRQIGSILKDATGGMEKYRAGVTTLAQGWLGDPQKDERPVLLRLYDGICRLWDRFRGKKPDVSPFEAIRTMKIVECPKYGDIESIRREMSLSAKKHASALDYAEKTVNAGEWAGVPKNIRAKYEKIFDSLRVADGIDDQERWAKSLKAEQARAALAREMLSVNPLYGPAFRLIQEDREIALLLYSKKFMAAMGKPYSQWTKAERDACSVLDAIWHADNGRRAGSDQRGHWKSLNAEIISMARNSPEDLEKRLQDSCRDMLASKSVWKKLFGPQDLPGDFSPFEAFRMLKMSTDPAVDTKTVIKDIEAYSNGFASGSVPEYSSGIAPVEGSGDEFKGERYCEMTSPAFAAFLESGECPKGASPVEIRLSGKQGNVLLRCMSNEKEAVRDAFILSMGQGNVLEKQCDTISSAIISEIGKRGRLDTKLLTGGEEIGHLRASPYTPPQPKVEQEEDDDPDWGEESLPSQAMA